MKWSGRGESSGESWKEARVGFGINCALKQNSQSQQAQKKVRLETAQHGVCNTTWKDHKNHLPHTTTYPRWSDSPFSVQMDLCALHCLVVP